MYILSHMSLSEELKGSKFQDVWKIPMYKSMVATYLINYEPKKTVR